MSPFTATSWQRCPANSVTATVFAVGHRREGSVSLKKSALRRSSSSAFPSISCVPIIGFFDQPTVPSKPCSMRPRFFMSIVVR